jgi:hypothetical protein
MLLNLTGCACRCNSVGQYPLSNSLHSADHMGLEHNPSKGPPPRGLSGTKIDVLVRVISIAQPNAKRTGANTLRKPP